MQTETLARAREVISDTIQSRFDVPFVKIAVTPDVDEDGDEFLWVKAVYDGQPENIDTRASITIVRHPQSKLAEASVEAFPVISYIAKYDLKEKEIEAL